MEFGLGRGTAVLEELGVPSDMAAAVALGLGLGAVVVVTLAFFPGTASKEVSQRPPEPGPPAAGVPPGKAQPAAGQAKAEADPFQDPKVLHSARKAANFFGISEQDYEKAVEDAKREYKDGASSSEMLGSSEWVAVANLIVYASLLGALIWAINHDYGNAFTKWFVLTFPREAEALGVKFPSGG
uniref:Uncharacterized protein n=1 Tax=Rhizochromulina marina TaxID=1034831 RepID=A0A7S2WVX5_9STRA|mmetsp:Transcript_6834/g.19834  ORF Transcript_6834/g.19834 Transcript_6834/m.19834 type:complete len:184 (+) Transcript_6834:55-606(+)